RHGLRHARAYVVDDAPQITSGDVARDHDPPLYVLAQNHVGAFLATNVGEQPDGHLTSRGRVDREVGNPFEVDAARRVELHDEVEGRATVENAPDGGAGERGFAGFSDIVRVQTVSSDRGAVSTNRTVGTSICCSSDTS